MGLLRLFAVKGYISGRIRMSSCEIVFGESPPWLIDRAGDHNNL